MAHPVLEELQCTAYTAKDAALTLSSLWHWGNWGTCVLRRSIRILDRPRWRIY